MKQIEIAISQIGVFMVGKYLTLAQIIKSQTATRKGIDNNPSETQLASIKLLIENVFDKVKEKFPNCFTSSFFRCYLLNIAIGGATGSQHEKGEAVDIDSEKDNKEIFEFIKTNLDFDQLIWEFGDNNSPSWVHVSYKKTGNRKEVLRAKKNSKGKAYYEKI